jgi:hypothetical protein
MRDLSMRSARWFALVLLVSVIGCASAPAGEGTNQPPRRDRYAISAEEIEASTRHNSTHEMVQALRPNWLRSRGGTVNNAGAGAVVVYLDGIRMGGVGVLHQIPRRDVVSLQYLDPSNATTRFGTGHMGGAILVSVRQAR